jgi:hypothetical protein
MDVAGIRRKLLQFCMNFSQELDLMKVADLEKIKRKYRKSAVMISQAQTRLYFRYDRNVLKINVVG